MSKPPRRRNGMIPQKVRCKATNRHGEQCRKWAMKGSVVCNKHGGAAPQVKRKAQERILMAQDDAASLLVRALSDDTIPFAERRRVAEFLLTYENRNEVQVMLAPWHEDIEGLLIDVPDNPIGDEVIDGEIVEDGRELTARYESDERLPSLLHDPPAHTRPGPRTR